MSIESTPGASSAPEDPVDHHQKQPKDARSKRVATAKPKRSWPWRLGRFAFWLLVILFALTLVVVGLLTWLAGTDAGFSRVTELANEHVPGLSISESSGNLRDGLQAKSIRFSNEAMDVQISQLQSDWRLGCLFEKKFCLDNIHIETLAFSSFATEEKPAQAARENAIALPEIVLPIDVDISNITIETLRFQPPDEAPAQTIEDVRLSVRVSQSTILLDEVALQYQQFSTQLTGKIDLQGDYPLDLSLAVSADDVLPDSVPEGDGNQPLRVEASFTQSLANLAIDTQISGLAQVNITATVQPLEPALPADIVIVSDALGWPISSRSQILAQNTRIAASGDIKDYTFSIESQLSGEQVPDTGITINGLANPERITVPGINMDTLGGSANGNALVSLDQPMVWSTRWRLENLDPSLHMPDLKGQLNGDFDASGVVRDGRWSLKLNEAVIDGELRELPFYLDAKLSKGLNDVWFIERFILNNDKNQLKAQGVVSEGIDLQADIKLPQLQNFLPGLAGGFEATLAVNGDVLNPDINVDASADVLRFNDILVRSLAIKGDIAQLFVENSALEVSVDTVRFGENTVRDAALSLTGERLDHQLTLSTRGPQDTAVDLVLAGALNDAFDWNGALDMLQATLPAHQLKLRDPAGIRWNHAEQRARVSPHCWSLSDASTLCLQDEFTNAPTGRTTLILDQYSLEQLNEFLPDGTTAAGQLGATVELSWGDAGPDDKRAVVSAILNDAQVQTQDALGDPLSVAYENIQLNVNATPTDARADLTLVSQTLGTAQIDVQLDPSDPDSGIDGAIDLQGLQLSIAEAFLPDFDEVSGTISAQGKLAGKLNAPEYNGTLELDAPVLRAEILPLPITGGRITARIAGQSVSLDGQILSNDGQIALDGRGTLDPRRWNAEVNLKGENLNIQSDPVQESTVNHDIQIAASARRISVTGNIRIPQAIIDVEELPEGASTVSSDVIIVEDIEEQAPEEVAATSQNLQVALDVSLGEDVNLSAYGLTANLTGDMDVRIRGARPPQLGGEIRVVDGIYKQYGQDLKAEGQVLFVGPVDGTRLAIDAVREIENEEPTRTAGLRIQGTVASPEITLFTEPSDKSQDAILSYVVLGRDINEASDQEADLLATAALALAVRGGKTFGSGVASKLGVEEFGLETRGSGDNTELIVSGRLNDRLLLRYGRGVFDSENTLYLRYELTKKLYLEAATGIQENAADLFYSFSF